MTVTFIEVVRAEHSRFWSDVLDLDIRVITEEGVEEVWPFTYVPSDGAPVTAAVATWLGTHPEFPVAAAVALSAADFGLNRRNVRSAFIGIGLGADAVDIAINAKPAGGEREDLMLSWLEDDSFRIDSPVVVAAFDYWVGIDPNLTLAALNTKWVELGRMLMATTPLVAPSEAVN